MVTLLHSCAAVPVAAHVQSTGAVFTAFDVGQVVAVAYGDGSFEVLDKATQIPVYRVKLDANTIVVADLSEAGLTFKVTLGEPLPARAEPIVRSLLSPAKILELGITFASVTTALGN